MAMYFYCQGANWKQSRSAKIGEDGLNDFFSFVRHFNQHLLQNFGLSTGEVFPPALSWTQQVYSSMSSRFRAHIIVQRQNGNIMIDRLPRDLKAFR